MCLVKMETTHFTAMRAMTLIYGREGNDTLNGGEGDDYLLNTIGNDVIIDNSGLNKIIFSNNIVYDDYAISVSAKDLFLLIRDR